MKNTLSKEIHYLIFNRPFFEKAYQERPELIRNDPSLLFKSIASNNAEAFCWLLRKVDISQVWESLFCFIFRKDRFLAYYKLLRKAYPEVLETIDAKKFVFRILLKNLTAYKQDQRRQKLKIFNELIKNNSFIDSDVLNDLIKKEHFHEIAIESIKQGITPLYKDNTFVEFCRKGKPAHVPFFKKLGCNVNYMNDLPLIMAAQNHNVEMVFYLIEKEGADLSVGNYFPILSVFAEDPYSERDPLPDNIILIFANYAYNKKTFPKSILKKLLKNKKFKISYNYLKTSEQLKIKEGLVPVRKKINKI
jgi:hypothetical protein